MNGTLFSKENNTSPLAEIMEFMVKPGTVDLVGNTRVFAPNAFFECRSTSDLSGLLFAHHAYYIALDNGEQFDFSVSQIGLPVERVGTEKFRVRIRNKG